MSQLPQVSRKMHEITNHIVLCKSAFHECIVRELRAGKVLRCCDKQKCTWLGSVGHCESRTVGGGGLV